MQCQQNPCSHRNMSRARSWRVHVVCLAMTDEMTDGLLHAAGHHDHGNFRPTLPNPIPIGLFLRPASDNSYGYERRSPILLSDGMGFTSPRLMNGGIWDERSALRRDVSC